MVLHAELQAVPSWVVIPSVDTVKTLSQSEHAAPLGDPVLGPLIQQVHTKNNFIIISFHSHDSSFIIPKGITFLLPMTAIEREYQTMND